jgi:hypothetical protein
VPANATHPDYDANVPAWLRARDVFAVARVPQAEQIGVLPESVSWLDLVELVPPGNRKVVKGKSQKYFSRWFGLRGAAFVIIRDASDLEEPGRKTVCYHPPVRIDHQPLYRAALGASETCSSRPHPSPFPISAPPESEDPRPSTIDPRLPSPHRSHPVSTSIIQFLPPLFPSVPFYHLQTSSRSGRKQLNYDTAPTTWFTPGHSHLPLCAFSFSTFCSPKTAPFLHRFCTKYRAFRHTTIVHQQFATTTPRSGAILQPAGLVASQTGPKLYCFGLQFLRDDLGSALAL